MLIVELFLGLVELLGGLFRPFKKDEKRPNKSVSEEIGIRLLQFLAVIVIGFFVLIFAFVALSDL